MRKLIIALSIVGILALSVFAMFSLFSMKEEQSMHPEKKHVKYVKASRIVYSTEPFRLKTSGRVVAQNEISLSVEVQGKILQGDVRLKKGQSFKKGDLLLKIYDNDFLYALKARKSRFLTLLANALPDLKVDFPDAFPLWSNFFDEIDMGKALPELPKIKNRQEKIYLAAKNIISEYYGIKSDEIRLSKYRVIAPFDGTFTEVYSEVGAVANPGASLAKMIRTGQLEIEIPLSPEDAKFIQSGEEAIVFAGNGKVQKLKARVVRKSDFVDPRSQSINVYLSVNSAKQNLYKGQYVQAEIDAQELTNCMELDRRAVFNGNQVYTVEGGQLVRHEIHVVKMAEETLFFNGLPADTFLVTEALINPVEGSNVQILE